jgi:hypothetical protein
MSEIHLQHHLRVVCVSHLNILTITLLIRRTLIRRSGRFFSNYVFKTYVFGITNFVFVLLQETMVARESDNKSRDFMDMKSRQLDVQPKVTQVCGF